MTDVHCHILPGVDDGAESLEEALVMARMAQASGVRAIVATPHCNMPRGEKNYRSDELRDRFLAFAAALKNQSIDIRLLPGAEVLCTEDAPELLRKGKLLTLAGSRYLLTEFFFDEPHDCMTELLEALAAEGVIPVVAHPERYRAVQRDPELVARWFARGYVIQVNKGSLLGRLGRRARTCSHLLLERGLAHIIASDAHGCAERTPHMNEIRELTEELFSPEYARILLEENPGRILRDEPMSPVGSGVK